MKISFKIPAIATLSGLVLCAGVLSAGASGADNTNNANEFDCYTQTEYPEEFLPYVGELERINAELGTDYTFGIRASEAEDTIAFYTSMTIEEFRSYVYEAYENDIANPPFEGYKMTDTECSIYDVESGRPIIGEVPSDDLNVQYVELSDYGYFRMSDGTEIPVLSEHFDKCIPYMTELQNIYREFGTGFIPDLTTEENVERVLSMSVEEFGDFVRGAEVNDVDVVKHNGGFWYFEDNAPIEPANDHKVKGATLDENGEISVTPSGELSPGNNVTAHEYGADEPREPHDFTENSTVGNAGIYRGDGRVYPCDLPNELE